MVAIIDFFPPSTCCSLPLTRSQLGSCVCACIDYTSVTERERESVYITIQTIYRRAIYFKNTGTEYVCMCTVNSRSPACHLDLIIGILRQSCVCIGTHIPSIYRNNYSVWTIMCMSMISMDENNLLYNILSYILLYLTVVPFSYSRNFFFYFSPDYIGVTGLFSIQAAMAGT